MMSEMLEKLLLINHFRSGYQNRSSFPFGLITWGLFSFLVGLLGIAHGIKPQQDLDVYGVVGCWRH